jgi:hypothetical protein
MTISDDLNAASTLCANAADAAGDKLSALGARPTDMKAAAAWDAQAGSLRQNISKLNNLSSSISALIVVKELQSVWPELDQLNQVTASAQSDLVAIADTTKVILALATVINFGNAIVTLVAQPNLTSASALVTAFENLAKV